MAFHVYGSVLFSMCVASVLSQGPLLNAIVPPPSGGSFQPPQQPPFNAPLNSQVTPLANLPMQGQIQAQAAPPANAPFGISPQGQQLPPPVFQQQPPAQAAPPARGLPSAGVAVAPPAGGPLATLAAANNLANAINPPQQNMMSTLPLLALGGNSDAIFPYMMLSQTGMLQRNPMLSFMVMNNY